MDDASAKKYINKLLKKEPANIECILKLANIYLKSGEILKGYKYISRAYEVNPEAVMDSDAKDILEYALKITDLEKRAKKTKDKFLWNKLGNDFFEMGIYDETIKAYEKSLIIDNTQEKISLKLVLSYKKNNQTYKALEQLKLLLEQNDKNFYANYYLGKILKYSLQDKESAQEYFAIAQASLLQNEKDFTEDELSHLKYDITLELAK